MIQNNQFARIASVLTMAFWSLGFCGCSAMLGRSKGPLDNLDVRGMKAAGYTFNEFGAEKPVLSDNGEPCIVLEVVDGKRHFEKIPIPQGQNMFVADIVRDAKLYKKLGRMKVSVLRPNGVNRPPVRMDVDFDDKGKNVMEGMNYSLRAGDHVVVRPTESSFFTEMLQPLSFGK